MNISLGKWLLLLLGAVLIVAGVFYFVTAVIPDKDWVMGIFAVIAIAIGSVLVSGKLLTVTP